MSDIGKVVKNTDGEYGVVWRSDKFSRLSVKFANGKEIGALDRGEIDFVSKADITTDNVMDKLSDSGLIDFVKMDECRELINDSMNQERIFIKTLNGILEELYSDYLKGSSTEDIKQKLTEGIGCSGLSADNKNKQYRIVDNLNSAFRVVKYVTSTLNEKKDASNMWTKQSLYLEFNNLDKVLDDIVCQLANDGKEFV